jgi:hypothetical protein
VRPPGYALKAGQLTYDYRYATMHGMPVTGGCDFRSLKPLWYNGVPPYVGTREHQRVFLPAALCVPYRLFTLFEMVEIAFEGVGIDLRDLLCPEDGGNTLILFVQFGHNVTSHHRGSLHASIIPLDCEEDKQ